MAEVVRGKNQFALDLYARLRRQPGNLFLSPAGLSTALAVTYAGARGEAVEEMAGKVSDETAFGFAPHRIFALHRISMASGRALAKKFRGDA